MLRLIWVLVLTVILTFIFSVAAVLTGIFNPYSRLTNGIIRTWAKSILYISGVKVEVKGLENIDPTRSYIYMPNHQSAFDILACVVAIPGTVRFIAKKELFRIPIFAQGMLAAGMIPIDRGNSAEAHDTLNRALDKIKNGVSVIIFPEGTRSRDGEIHPFKKGGFYIALLGGIPIVPMVIRGSFQILKKKSLKISHGRIKVEFLPPVETAGRALTERNKLVKEVFRQISDTFYQKGEANDV